MTCTSDNDKELGNWKGNYESYPRNINLMRADSGIDSESAENELDNISNRTANDANIITTSVRMKEKKTYQRR